MKRTMPKARILKHAGRPTRQAKAETKPPIIWTRTASRLIRLEELLAEALANVRAVLPEVAVGSR